MIIEEPYMNPTRIRAQDSGGGAAAHDFEPFMRAAFAPVAEGAKVALARAVATREGKGVWFKPTRWTLGMPRPPMLGLHYAVSTYKVQATRARAENVSRTFAFALDDVGDYPHKS